MFTNLKKDEFNLFFEKEILNSTAVLDEDRLRKFKLLILRNPHHKPDEIFFKAINQNEGLSLSRVLIFFFIYINWLSIHEINDLYRNTLSKDILKVPEKVYFEDKQDGHFYNFNSLFAQYIADYMKDIENIYIIKNSHIETSKYAQSIINEEIGYEGLYFFLMRTNLAFALFESFNWILVEKEEYTGFKYAAEVVSRQLIEEYMFVRSVSKELLNNCSKMIKSMHVAHYLFLYELLVWKEKRMDEIHRKFDWFFNTSLIKFPAPLSIDAENEKLLNHALLEYQTSKDEVKFVYQNKASYELFNKKSIEYFKHFVTGSEGADSLNKLYSKNSILDRLGSANLILSHPHL